MSDSTPIPMILTCPLCSARHIDRGVFATKPHHTHACQECGLPWRPAIVATVGVQFLPGFKDEDPLSEPASETPNGRYLEARINPSDFGANILRLGSVALLESTFPDCGVEMWTQVSLTLDERLRRLDRKQQQKVRVTVSISERELLFSEPVSRFSDGVPMILPRAYEVDYAAMGFAIRVEGLTEMSSDYAGMLFRFGAKTMPKAVG